MLSVLILCSLTGIAGGILGFKKEAPGFTAATGGGSGAEFTSDWEMEE
jgi:hypothetical protein